MSPLPFQGRGSGGLGLQPPSHHFPDFLHNIVRAPLHLIIGEANHLEAPALQHFSSVTIFIWLSQVDASVHLHDEAGGVAIEVDDEAIDLAIRAEHGCGHTASIYSRDVNAITRMARDIDVSIFVANAAHLAGLGDGGEGYTSFSIASPTGEGLTRPRSFSRDRRMTVAGGLRIV